ncbi:hypothetical protein C8F01DRAFT_1370701 [Mycena amicta]|nr:hypothetical protein C8F01DRAFT_1370701 [Mycena amicta]
MPTDRLNDQRALGDQVYRLATGGEDNHTTRFRIVQRVEYLATVNVVRVSPNGELIVRATTASGHRSATLQTSTYVSDLRPEDLQNERECWKPRTTFRCTTMQVYARVFATVDRNCVHEIAEHSQSLDRSMHVYRISTSKLTPSVATPASRIIAGPRLSIAKIVPAAVPFGADPPSCEVGRWKATPKGSPVPATPLLASSSTAMFPPPPADSLSRRSSFSGSNAPSSPDGFFAVSGSPVRMDVRTPPSSSAGWAGAYEERSSNRGRYDERRSQTTDGSRILDGGMLLTPAGMFEDASASVPGWDIGDGWARKEAKTLEIEIDVFRVEANGTRLARVEIDGSEWEWTGTGTGTGKRKRLLELLSVDGDRERERELGAAMATSGSMDAESSASAAAEEEEEPADDPEKRKGRRRDFVNCRVCLCLLVLRVPYDSGDNF